MTLLGNSLHRVQKVWDPVLETAYIRLYQPIFYIRLLPLFIIIIIIIIIISISISINQFYLTHPFTRFFVQILPKVIKNRYII